MMKNKDHLTLIAFGLVGAAILPLQYLIPVFFPLSRHGIELPDLLNPEH